MGWEREFGKALSWLSHDEILAVIAEMEKGLACTKTLPSGDDWPEWKKAKCINLKRARLAIAKNVFECGITVVMTIGEDGVPRDADGKEFPKMEHVEVFVDEFDDPDEVAATPEEFESDRAFIAERVALYLTEHFGPQCERFEESCIVCQQWHRHALLFDTGREKPPPDEYNEKEST